MVVMLGRIMSMGICVLDGRLVWTWGIDGKMDDEVWVRVYMVR